MARQISEEIAASVKDLITQMSGFQEATDAFNYIQRHILTTLKKADTMYFLNKREVDENIASMAEKFTFHGFSPQAKALQDSYKCYISENLPKPELINRLNIVKLLLCLSERPTSNFIENPQEFQTEKKDEEEEINWGEYLKEGIETWTPNFDEGSDDSESSFSENDTDGRGNRSGHNTSHLPTVIDDTEKGTIVDLRANREELLATIQHTWYNQTRFHMTPFSEWREANIAIHWDKFLENQVMDLIPIEKSCILSEYKVIREILWQLWSLHTSAVFQLERNNIKPKPDVTIASIRAEPFERFLTQFIPYMEVLNFFREFSKSLEIQTYDCITEVPQTYRSYDNSLQKILRPIYRKLSELEDRVREQETTYTLLKLYRDLQSILEPVMILKKIHKEVVVDFNKNNHLKCATYVLCALHNSLQFSGSKLEQDLIVTLFLESLYHYFSLIDCWLTKNELSDYSGEFIIVNKNRNNTSTYVKENSEESLAESDNWKLNFDLRDGLDDFCAKNGLLKIIRETVLQIGRNIHFLILLGKYSLFNDCKETIHQEFVRRSLEELEKFFKVNSEERPVEETFTNETFYDCVTEKKYKYPVICTDECKKPTEFDKLENLVDTSDGFLMLAFEDYFVEKPEPPKQEDKTLFEKVSKITTTMFPTSNFFERILNGLLKERFTISGLMVKNILIEEYLLEKQFQFLRHMFLFCDDLIFPFYRRLFEKTNTHNPNWGNEIWLTSHLHDTVMDVYPEFYKKCLVQVKDGWRQCVDPLDACLMMSVQYEIQWPLNIIISGAQMALYKDIFGFIIQIKWALYTMNHLAFTDLESKKLDKKKPKTHGNAIMKLKYLKFTLTNMLNSTQHYIFSFIFTKCLQNFELEFEKANDLSSIIASHSNFINTIFGMVMDIRQSEKNFQAFKSVLSCVKLLKMMWKRLDMATPKRLSDCYKVYKKSYSAIEPIICPVYIYDY
ncbi:gamma-tubulin complex component 5-like [Anoplophora glabripennis]|uniref:gamma-tubulin complex component 5-like n=1 Tax=Anoplophora glabripennis TaxID=217634 RepID=UPI000873B417|nr:gamma-tubulin complex component 5-like [Anoplophora glabripennis]